MSTNEELPSVLPEQPVTDNANPSPVLVIFLVLPLLGILVALLMVATEMRNQRTQDGITQIVDNPATLINYAAPDFNLPTLDGQQVSLADYRGKILFLNFWQTTCVPCITEMPEFLDFMADQNPDKVALLAINVAESPGLVREFFATNDIIGIPTALDNDSAVHNEYGVHGYPMTFIINEEGVVRFLSIGGLNYDDMEEYLNLVQITDAEVRN
jgi:cytochrome c biogenesis protein CcmG, thiol:disulfide interchange protein DsbE